MMMEATTTKGIQVMASFRSKLKTLMLQKSVDLGKPLQQIDVARETGLPAATIQRWYDYGQGFKRIDSEVLYPLLDYFNCKFEDLIERVD